MQLMYIFCVETEKCFICLRLWKMCHHCLWIYLWFLWSLKRSAQRQKSTRYRTLDMHLRYSWVYLWFLWSVNACICWCLYIHLNAVLDNSNTHIYECIFYGMDVCIYVWMCNTFHGSLLNIFWGIFEHLVCNFFHYWEDFLIIILVHLTF
mgnify:CR=1 FL=1